MKLHLISGFLGSGKTTSIVTLSKYLMEQGMKVAVITNDQGKYLVDTAFMLAQDIPAVDVQSGCFCSNYHDLVKQLDELKVKIDPDIVFAESIGSAGNLIGTVLKPLLEDSTYVPSSLSTVVDARLFLRLLKDEILPFSDSVISTFRGQINESDLLIINKIDMISLDDMNEIIDQIKIKYPSKQYLLQSAFSKDDIQHLSKHLDKLMLSELRDAGLDDALHQRALRRLKWHEKVYDLTSDHNVFDDIRNIMDTMLIRLSGTPRVIAHIKVFIEFNDHSIKCGITSLNEEEWREKLNGLTARSAKMILNARIHSDDPIEDIFP
jgi:G3E family GTPase